MRSRALTAGCPPVACVLRYARHVRAPAPAAAARSWQILSAPASPPRLPVAGDALLTKKRIGCCGAAGCCAQAAEAKTDNTADATICFLIAPSSLVPYFWVIRQIVRDVAF